MSSFLGSHTEWRIAGKVIVTPKLPGSSRSLHLLHESEGLYGCSADDHERALIKLWHDAFQRHPLLTRNPAMLFTSVIIAEECLGAFTADSRTQRALFGVGRSLEHS